jgi:YD repeat-containing protein
VTLRVEQDRTIEPAGIGSECITKASGTTDLSQTRSHVTPDLRSANEISSVTTSIGTAWASPAHDLAGNMSSFPKPADPANSYGGTYDAWNRLVGVTDGQSTVATYAFDGMGRRIQKTTGQDSFDDYYTTDHQLLEVRKNADTDPLEQYVWGLDYIDSAVLRFRDSDSNGTLDETLYVLHDANFTVSGLIERERYTYVYSTRLV